ncbi:MAG: hypothetical protein ACK4GQ_05165 [Candidatus Hadarchaeales archaeon]
MEKPFSPLNLKEIIEEGDAEKIGRLYVKMWGEVRIQPVGGKFAG